MMDFFGGLFVLCMLALFVSVPIAVVAGVVTAVVRFVLNF